MSSKSKKPRINYDKLQGKKHPLCKGEVNEIQGGQGGTEHICRYNTPVDCMACRFFIPNRGRGKDPRI